MVGTLVFKNIPYLKKNHPFLNIYLNADVFIWIKRFYLYATIRASPVPKIIETHIFCLDTNRLRGIMYVYLLASNGFEPFGACL